MEKVLPFKNKTTIAVKKLSTLIFLVISVLAYGQDNQPSSKPPGPQKPSLGLGIKAGLNFANITNASSINSSSRTGFLVGVFMNPQTGGVMSYRTEITFSRQGYNYGTNSSTGNVNLSYLMIPQFMGINITKFVQLQLGFQMAFLLNAKADSSKAAAPGNPYGSLMNYYNKFDYGAGAGIEVYPVKFLLVGARYNLSFGNLYKDPTSFPAGTTPNFIPPVNVKNNVVQLYAGFRF